jgi:hypothetical protein
MQGKVLVDRKLCVGLRTMLANPTKAEELNAKPHFPSRLHNSQQTKSEENSMWTGNK